MIFVYLLNFYRDFRNTIEWSSFSAFFETLRMFPLMRRVRKHTKVRIPRLKALYRLVRGLDAKGIPGDIVEFGVWRGGSAAVMACAARHSPFRRRMWLFDSFEGNSPPTSKDGALVHERFHEGWNRATLQDVETLFARLHIGQDRYRIIKGWFHETIPSFGAPMIALIHFDADMEEAAKLSLEKFYDHVAPGGYLVFNSWAVREGVRRVWDEITAARGEAPIRISIDAVACYFEKPPQKESIEKKHYHGMQHDTKRRFISYWHQINEALQLQPERVLEVGIGNGFVSRYLKEFCGVSLTTCDYNERLGPDRVASVTALPFSDNAFDVIMACEVLEHMPYEASLRGLHELHRVTSRAVIISLPDATRAFRIEIPFPKWGKIKKLIILPLRNPPTHIVTRQDGHHWEIGKKDYPLSRIIGDLQKIGFILERTYRVFENPYHRFFVLKKL